jgi:hypothetical protein
LAGDPEFADDGSDEDSDDSEGSDFSDGDDDEEDYSSEADEGESEGLSWDELEKRAYEDDRSAA